MKAARPISARLDRGQSLAVSISLDSDQYGDNAMATASDIYRRHHLTPPQSCSTHIDKIASLSRHMAAMEETHRELMLIQDRLDFANKAYTFARLVKDTCVGFLELAGAIGGPQAARVSGLATAAVDTAQSASEVAHGQADTAEVVRRSLGTLNSMGESGPGGTFMRMKIQQGMDIEKMANDIRNAESRSEAQRRFINGMFQTLANTVASMAELAENQTLGRAVALVKAVQNYRSSLNDSFDQRIQTEYDIASARQRYLANNAEFMRRARNDLNEAMDLLNACQGREVRPQR